MTIQGKIKLLIGTSSGDLLNLLLNLDTEQNNIHSLDDLYQYLIEQARYNDYSEEDVVRMFLNLLKILEYEPIVEVIPPAEAPAMAPPHGRNWVFYIMGGIVLILLIILFSRRRRKEDRKDTD
jgi:LPXTG-motif cell wall-anchored protein